MTFPPGWFLREMATFLELRGLLAAVVELHPYLDNHAKVPDTGPSMLQIDLPNRPRIVTGVIRANSYSNVWMIHDGRPRSEPSFWPLETPTDVLARAIVARVDALQRDRPQATPWLWDEPCQSKLTELADELTAQGAEVVRVIAHNRCISARHDGELRVTQDVASAGHYLHVEQGDNREDLEIALRQGLGWTIERIGSQGVSRLDVGGLVTGVATQSPGLPEDDVTVPELVRAVLAVLDRESTRRMYVMPDVGWQDRPPVWGVDGLDVAETVARWLRWFGYRDARAGGSDRRPAVRASQSTVEIRMTSSWADVAAVQRLVGVASVEGQQAVMVCTSGYTRDARKWAEKAGAALFWLSVEDGQLRSDSSLASALMLPLPEPLFEHA